jgi:hypothetical protein
MVDNVRLTNELVSLLGKPLLPTATANVFVSQCGIVVRDKIPITVQEWNKPAKEDVVNFVHNRSKEVLWESLMSHFIQPVLETEALTKAMRLKVKE